MKKAVILFIHCAIQLLKNLWPTQNVSVLSGSGASCTLGSGIRFKLLQKILTYEITCLVNWGKMKFFQVVLRHRHHK